MKCEDLRFHCTSISTEVETFRKKWLAMKKKLTTADEMIRQLESKLAHACKERDQLFSTLNRLFEDIVDSASDGEITEQLDDAAIDYAKNFHASLLNSDCADTEPVIANGSVSDSKNCSINDKLFDDSLLSETSSEARRSRNSVSCANETQTADYFSSHRIEIEQEINKDTEKISVSSNDITTQNNNNNAHHSYSSDTERKNIFDPETEFLSADQPVFILQKEKTNRNSMKILNESLWECFVCDKEFRYQYTLNEHFRKIHGMTGSTMKSVTLRNVLQPANSLFKEIQQNSQSTSAIDDHETRSIQTPPVITKVDEENDRQNIEQHQNDLTAQKSNLVCFSYDDPDLMCYELVDWNEECSQTTTSVAINEQLCPNAESFHAKEVEYKQRRCSTRLMSNLKRKADFFNTTSTTPGDKSKKKILTSSYNLRKKNNKRMKQEVKNFENKPKKMTKR